MVEINSIKDAQDVGLNISGYEIIDGHYWLNAGDASLLVSHINSRPADVRYLSNYVRQGRLNPKRISPKASLYQFDELIKIRTKIAGRPKLPDDQVTPSALRQREFKEKRRAAGLAQKEEECPV
jgi:hypothetical protein